MTIRPLNFSPPFVPMVESGAKPHTVRARRADGRDPEPGDTLHLYAGLRTKSVRLLRREPCAYTIDITIRPSAGDFHNVMLGDRLLEQREVEVLALTDGFRNGVEFIAYFEQSHGLPFSGLLIGWEPIPAYVTRH